MTSPSTPRRAARLPALAAAAVLLAGGAAQAGGNLLANGSFEAGTFTPDAHGVQHLDIGWSGPFPIDVWTPFVGGLFWVDNANSYGIQASDGRRSVNLYDPFRPLVGVGSLQQTITSTVGMHYDLQFDIGTSSAFPGPAGVRVEAAGQSADFINNASNGWQTVHWSFTAIDTSTVVYFQGLGGNGYLGLDNAVLTAAVPEPATWALLAGGLALTAWRRRRRADPGPAPRRAARVPLIPLIPLTPSAALATLALLGTAAAPASAQVLDDFDGAIGSQTVVFSSIPTPTLLDSKTVAAPVPGGTRRLQLTADVSAPGTTSAALSGSGDLWAFASNGQRTNFNLAYGTQTAMNLDLSGASALRLAVYYSSPVQLVVYASTQTTPGGNPDASAVSLSLPDLFQQTVDIPLSAFSTNSVTGSPVNWADVDGLSFFVSASGTQPPSGDGFWIQQLSAVAAVPEPASAALLLAGLALGGGLAVGRRRGRGVSTTSASRAHARPRS